MRRDLGVDVGAVEALLGREHPELRNSPPRSCRRCGIISRWWTVGEGEDSK